MAFREWKIVKILAGIATRIWAASGAALIACFILYCFYGGIFAFLLLMISLSCILYHAQDNLLYHPNQPPQSRVFIPVPSMHGLPYESINVRSTDNAMLHMFWIRHPGDKGRFVPSVVYLHGNAGNIGHRLHNAAGIYHKLQCNILLVEYRGYGLSTGQPHERGLYADARAAVDYLYTRHDLDQQQIILFGRSLGGAVAIDVAADPEYFPRVMSVIVENTFTSIPDMGKYLIHPGLRYLPNCCYKNQYRSSRKIKFFAIPCLFISGLADTLVPPNMMNLLHKRCGSAHKRLLQIPRGTHNDTWLAAGYYEGIAEFLTECRDFRGPLQTAPVSSNQWIDSVFDV